jgi:hypothetical protein
MFWYTDSIKISLKSQTVLLALDAFDVLRTYQYLMINSPQNVVFLHQINVVNVINDNILW